MEKKEILTIMKKKTIFIINVDNMTMHTIFMKMKANSNVVNAMKFTYNSAKI
jgi:hypothetical protein